jgi:hypothetical protein
LILLLLLLLPNAERRQAIARLQLSSSEAKKLLSALAES